MQPDESPDETETDCEYDCLVGTPRSDYCDEMGPSGLLCSRPAGHDGPHAACTAHEHPARVWSDDGRHLTPADEERGMTEDLTMEVHVEAGDADGSARGGDGGGG